jgi:hypothetical protein
LEKYIWESYSSYEGEVLLSVYVFSFLGYSRVDIEVYIRIDRTQWERWSHCQCRYQYIHLGCNLLSMCSTRRSFTPPRTLDDQKKTKTKNSTASSEDRTHDLQMTQSRKPSRFPRLNMRLTRYQLRHRDTHLLECSEELMKYIPTTHKSVVKTYDR